MYKNNTENWELKVYESSLGCDKNIYNLGKVYHFVSQWNCGWFWNDGTYDNLQRKSIIMHTGCSFSTTFTLEYYKFHHKTIFKSKQTKNPVIKYIYLLIRFPQHDKDYQICITKICMTLNWSKESIFCIPLLPPSGHPDFCSLNYLALNKGILIMKKCSMTIMHNYMHNYL